MTPNFSSAKWWASTADTPRGDVFDAEIVSDLDAMVTLRFRGRGAVESFKQEGGGHRWQRIPPTERGGRKHSSTITVAVIPENGRVEFELNRSDCHVRRYRSSGPGGQKKNKTETAVEITHKPTGITAVCESERSLNANLENAYAVLESRIVESIESARSTEENSSRRQQVGTGMRSDKIRTVQEQNGIVKNHLNGKKLALKQYLKGQIERLL